MEVLNTLTDCKQLTELCWTHRTDWKGSCT